MSERDWNSDVWANDPHIKRTCGLNFARLRIWRPTRRAAPRQRALISLRNEVVPALFWGKAGWRVSASWKIILRPTRRAAPRQRALISLRNEVVLVGQSRLESVGSWKIMLISQGVKRKRSQPATTSSRCREVHIFCGEAMKAALGRSSTARTLHDVAIVPLAMALMMEAERSAYRKKRPVFPIRQQNPRPPDPPRRFGSRLRYPPEA